MHHLDCLRLHTCGTPLTLHNLLARMSPSHSALTYVCDKKDSLNLYAQVINRQFAEGGQFSFVVGDPYADPGNMIELLEKIIQAAGDWRVFHLLADLPEGEPFREAFVRAGFRVWAHQRVYRLNQKDGNCAPATDSIKFEWRSWTHADMRAMQQLYHLVVPGLFQSIEPLTRRTRLGLVAYDEKGSLLGYADLDSGPKGVWVQPVIDPNVSNPQLLRALLAEIPEVFGRPIFLATRSYQPWTQNIAEQLGSSDVSSQTLLVRYLAKPKLAYEPERDFAFEAAIPSSGRSQIGDSSQSKSYKE
jgi:hypothetical protein